MKEIGLMEIRLEQAGDAYVIRRLTNVAFQSVPYSRKTEAAIVDALRAAGALTISLVAVENGEIVGHVAFSPATVGGKGGHWYGVGPVSVWPSQQRKGIGQALIHQGLDRLRHLSATGAVLVGDPGYYGRFGFVSNPAVRCGDVPLEYALHLAFTDAVPRGEIAFHPGFDAK